MKPSRCPRLPPYRFSFTSSSLSLTCWNVLAPQGHMKMHIWHPGCYLCGGTCSTLPAHLWPSWVKTVHQKMKSGQRDRDCDESGHRQMPLSLGTGTVGHTQQCRQPGVEYVKHSLPCILEENTRSWRAPLLAWAKVDGYPENKRSSSSSKKIKYRITI